MLIHTTSKIAIDTSVFCCRTTDGHWIAVSGSTPNMAERFLEGYGLGELLVDPRFETIEARVKHSEELDNAVRDAIGTRTLAENMKIIKSNKLPAQRVQTIGDIENDAHWQARQLTVEVGQNGRAIRMHNVFPRLSATSGDIRWPGGELGEHNEEVYCGELHVSPAELHDLQNRGVV